MRSLVVIPARMGSTRFPGKPLVDLCGKPMVQWVVEACQRADIGDGIIVATPDQEIVDACRSFGADAMLTSEKHPTGTDRIAEVARTIEADAYINVQGDEPLIRPATIQACGRPMLERPEVEMSSVYSACPPEEEDHPAVVKVVTDNEGFALYFSRYAIPFERNRRAAVVKKHVGIYGYRREVLLRFAEWPPSALEQTESLEQLRFLENGVRIFMSEGAGSELAVDTPEQAEEVRRILMVR